VSNGWFTGDNQRPGSASGAGQFGDWRHHGNSGSARLHVDDEHRRHLQDGYFNSGSFTMTGLVNKLVTAPRQYEQTGTASGEFSFLWDRTAFTGASGGWFIDRSKKGSCNDR
jgi:hypothetical protein